MKLPNHESAVVDLAKLRDYCLSQEHPRGRHKARMFAAILGFTAQDAEELQQALLSAAHTYEAFSMAGDKISSNIAMWTKKAGSVELSNATLAEAPSKLHLK